MVAEKTRIDNQLGPIRKSRGVSASELARRVKVSRQTIYAIEAGTYVPNTALALNLARELEVTVEDLFSLYSGSSQSTEPLSAELLHAGSAPEGQPVRICRIGSRWVAVPVNAWPYYLPEADGLVSRIHRANARADLLVLAKNEAAQKRLVLAGCDPATGLLARMVEKTSGVEVVCAGASSKLALAWLFEGKVHIAGSHLEDAKTSEFNLPFIRKQFPNDEFTVITFARWEEGLVVAVGNPKGVRTIEHLSGKTIRFVNRETGSGSRALLDRLLHTAGMPAQNIRGYDRIAYGHLRAAYCVQAGQADVCVATHSAARTFNLDFVPLHSERYDLVMRKRTAEIPAAQSFLDVLQRSSLRRKLEVLAGYDTSQTGTVLL